MVLYFYIWGEYYLNHNIYNNVSDEERLIKLRTVINKIQQNNKNIDIRYIKLLSKMLIYNHEERYNIKDLVIEYENDFNDKIIIITNNIEPTSPIKDKTIIVSFFISIPIVLKLT